MEDALPEEPIQLIEVRYWHALRYVVATLAPFLCCAGWNFAHYSIASPSLPTHAYASNDD